MLKYDILFKAIIKLSLSLYNKNSILLLSPFIKLLLNKKKLLNEKLLLPIRPIPLSDITDKNCVFHFIKRLLANAIDIAAANLNTKLNKEAAL